MFQIRDNKGNTLLTHFMLRYREQAGSPLKQLYNGAHQATHMRVQAGFRANIESTLFCTLKITDVLYGDICGF